MKAKNLMLLLLPGAFFVLLAVDGFAGARLARRDHNGESERQNQLKYDATVQNLKAGKWLVTEDAMIEALRRNHVAAKSESEFVVSLGEIMQWLGWFAVIGFCTQVMAIFAFVKGFAARNGSNGQDGTAYEK